ncbi:TrmB family transcriptional regulator [Halorussus limi]|uniref:TrmB family transcriptional regulator n=1 Tax=Halorussus limi TaxID=2938695 RepID=A0A8U0HYG8_9EURY|nr:helix-turn-helix domain-containing protein [Halorussus limi]UPV75676.1 TrmB family transcriptional regulator [Halorussus limi]
MAGKSTEQLEYECANLLKEFGFSEYEAYTFVYLLRLGTGTAKDVAEVGDVPRTRVYDAVDALHEAGLVDIQHTSPKKFTPVSRESALRKLDLQRENTITELSELLEDLEPATQQPEEFGVWTVTNHEAVTSRLLEFIDDAEDELIYMTVDELLTDDHLDHLKAAEERGVDIYVAGLSDPVRAQIQEQVPSAELFETLWAWSEEGAGSLLVTDKRTALVSVLVDEDAPDGIHETGIWGTGENNSLVVVLRAIFTWRLDALTSESSE